MNLSTVYPASNIVAIDRLSRRIVVAYSSVARLMAFCVMVVCLTTCVISAAANERSNWPQFRGPGGDGVALDARPPLQFGPNENQTWRTDIPGKGWSSPIVDDGIVWVTTAIERAADANEIEARMQKSGVKPREMKSRSVAAAIELHLIGLDFASGEVVRDVTLVTHSDPDAIHSLNSYASPTPVAADGTIYCHFGTYGTYAVDAKNGQILWQHRDQVVHAVGPGSSPVVDGDRLILVLDGCEQQRVLVLDRHDGSEIWQTERPEMDAPDGDQKKAFCTPVVVESSDGRKQYLCLASQYMVSYHPDDGRELWRCYHGRGFSIVPRPVFADDVVYFSTGFGKTELFAVDVTGDGDVTDTHVRWTSSRGVPKKPSLVLHDGLIYMIDDSGVMSCLDQRGEPVWKKRIGGNHSASPTIAGNHLIVASQEGVVTILSLGRQSDVIGKIDMGDRIMASPAAIGDTLVLRTESAIYRFDRKP